MDANTDSLLAYLTRMHPLLLVNRLISRVTTEVAGFHYHASVPDWRPPVRADRGPWHPPASASFSLHEQYWRYHHRTSGPAPSDFTFLRSTLSYRRLPTLRSLSLDFWTVAQAPAFSVSAEAHLERSFLHEVGCLLKTISATSCRIEDLSLRIPSDQGILDAVVGLVAKQYNLHKVDIDVQSLGQTTNATLSRLDLSALALSDVQYQPFQVFTLRGPDIDLHCRELPHNHPGLLSRFQATKELVLACNSFVSSTPSWIWLHSFLKCSPNIVLLEMSVDNDDNGDFDKTQYDGEDLQLPLLRQLIIQIPAVDSYLLRLLHAPSLYALRVRSHVDIALWPDCDENQFPSIFFSNVRCPGLSYERLYVLGIPTQRYQHNWNHLLSASNDSDYESIAYIKPYDAYRPRGNTTSYARARLPPHSYHSPLPVCPAISPSGSLTSLASQPPSRLARESAQKSSPSRQPIGPNVIP
ncbi:hypothetical protein A4X13_0g3816 [Tilletia indica]|uniref:F-box domain-containing protein n=1 Tax=Tilletia indica TaxID=43049 RepID=A0A177TER6_9BASI|nr:hypothetical protein A4X13_0g3816 [Tilletia indica]